MTSVTVFNRDISPKNDFKEIFVGDNKFFVNKDKTLCHENEEVMCISKNNENADLVAIYAKLLDLNPHSENVYKELIARKGHVEHQAQFQRDFCEKYNISRMTFVRALNELRARGIAVVNGYKVDVVDIYNIYEAAREAKSVLIILKTT